MAKSHEYVIPIKFDETEVSEAAKGFVVSTINKYCSKSWKEFLLKRGWLQRWQTYITDLEGMHCMVDKKGLTANFTMALAERGITDVKSYFLPMRDGTKLHVLYKNPPIGGNLAFLFHGNKGNWFNNPGAAEIMSNGEAYDQHYRLKLLEECTKDGFGFMAFSLPGYNPSTGSPSQINFTEACEVFAKHAIERAAELKIGPHKVVVCGESLGGAAATIFAKILTDQGYPPGVLSLIATFDSLLGMTQNAFPEFKIHELETILEEQLNTTKTLKSLDKRKTCLHIVTAEGDSVIPAKNSYNLVKGAIESGLKLVHHHIKSDHTTWPAHTVLGGMRLVANTISSRPMVMKELIAVAMHDLEKLVVHTHRIAKL